MSTAASAKAPTQSTVYLVGVVSNAGSPIASGNLVLNVNPDGVTGLLSLTGWPSIALEQGHSQGVGAVWPTTVMWLSGSGGNTECSIVLEEVATPATGAVLCGVVLLTQNSKTTQGIMLIRQPA